jgi:hypothetical protein
LRKGEMNLRENEGKRGQSGRVSDTGTFWTLAPCIMQDAEFMVTIGDRKYIASLRYGLEGMRVGGTRRFRASPHLCYRDLDIRTVPKNAVLVFTIKSLQLAQP